jgi:hypothetical protein
VWVRVPLGVHTVRDEFHPAESETGQPGGLQRLESGAEGGEDLRLNRVERRVGRVEVEEPWRWVGNGWWDQMLGGEGRR